jgi:hypothetical protein
MNEIITHEACQQHCPRFALCAKMIETGKAHSFLAVTVASSVEFESEDGRIISSAEFWGTTDMSSEEAALYQETGAAMMSAGKNLQAALLQGCERSPMLLNMEAGEATYLCNSANASAVEFTEEDLL